MRFSGLIHIHITKSHRAELDKSVPREDKEIFYSQGLGMLSPDCSTLLEVFEEIDNKYIERKMWQKLCLESILYLNMILGTQAGFNNLTSQIQTLDSNMSQFKSEIIGKIEVHCIGFNMHRYRYLLQGVPQKSLILFYIMCDNSIIRQLKIWSAALCHWGPLKKITQLKVQQVYSESILVYWRDESVKVKKTLYLWMLIIVSRLNHKELKVCFMSYIIILHYCL